MLMTPLPTAFGASQRSVISQIVSPLFHGDKKSSAKDHTQSVKGGGVAVKVKT